MALTGETKVLGEKHVPVPLHPPQMSHGLAWDRSEDHRLSNTTVTFVTHRVFWNRVLCLLLGPKRQQLTGR